MTKLAEAIRNTVRMEAPQIGFSPTPVKARSTMLLVAQLANGAAAPAGADVVLTKPSAAPKSSGASKDGTNGAKAAPLRGALLSDDATAAEGFDFLVFNGDQAPASVLLEENAGLVMQTPDDLSDSLLQSLQWLPLDALLVNWDGIVTVRRQLELQRLAGFSRKPLLLVVSGEPKASELEALREAGVVGIVVDLAGQGGAERFASLRTTIDHLRPRPKRSRSENGVVSTSVSMLPVAAPEPDQEDEPDEDE